MADEEEQKEGPPAPPAPETPRPNKLHEWCAAAVLMMVLAAILYTFVSFIRSSGM